MRHTAKQPSQQTTAAMYRAMDRQHPITITYLKEEKDDAGKKTGQLIETVRTIEPYDIRTTKAGDLTVKAMDRETGESRTFRADRITAYTIHRTAYLVPRPAPAATVAAIPVPASAAALVARELGRDERTTRRLAPAA